MVKGSLLNVQIVAHYSLARLSSHTSALMPCLAWLLLSLCAAVAADRALRISELVRAAPYGQSDPLSVNGILWLEHINMIVGKRALAEAFYVDFLGLTLDPASGDRSRDSFHLNIGRQQASAMRKCHAQVSLLTSLPRILPCPHSCFSHLPHAFFLV